MISQRVHDDFLVRYYYWALEEVKREVRENFRFLRTIGSGIPYQFVKMADRTEASDAVRVLTDLVMRRMTKARQILGEQSSHSDRQVAASFADFNFSITGDTEVQEPQTPSKAFISSHKKETALKIEEALQSFFKVKAYHYEALTWRYDVQIGEWPLQTWVDLGGRGSKLRYNHSIGAFGEQPLHENISLCSWLGLSSATQWNHAWRADPSYLAQTLADICKHFVNAAPKLLINLGVR